MNAVSLIYRKITAAEFNAISDIVVQDNGGGQTYIDFPKGSISDDELNEFFGYGEPVRANGYTGFRWNFQVHSLSLDSIQNAEISVRRASSNSLRNQTFGNRISILEPSNGFPSDEYDPNEDPIIFYIIKNDNNEFWAGWFYRSEYTSDWFLTLELSKLFYKDCAYIKLECPISFDSSNREWPFVGVANSHRRIAMSPKYKQIIYFGAPGTGKSFKVEKEGNEDDRIRTTFHPDTDYSSFVGCYKPMQDEEDSKKIVYKFEGQCFAKAYVEAWKRLVAREEGENINYTLVIEEINRGNCAQIFGDIFQLLDRDEDGFSQYGIQPDEDLTSYLREEFESLDIHDRLTEYGYPKIAEGTEMKLPPNLSIIATMNTSDQSLFPIDSAFKRRWDWEYIPIQYEPKDEDGNRISNKIDIEGRIYEWGKFIKAVNERIYDLTKSEDKELGYFFVRPAKGENITTQRFVSKVIFYLWSDIYKDYVGRDNSIFKFSEDGDEKNRKDHSFNSFFDNGIIKVNLVMKFIEQFEDVKNSASDEDDDLDSSGKRNQYSINGEGPFSGKQLATEALRLYVRNNPDKTAQEVVNEWNALGLSEVLRNGHFVETAQFYRSTKVPCMDSSVWVSTYGWTYNPTESCPTPTIPILINAVNEKDWGIRLGIIEP